MPQNENNLVVEFSPKNCFDSKFMNIIIIFHCVNWADTNIYMNEL